MAEQKHVLQCTTLQTLLQDKAKVVDLPSTATVAEALLVLRHHSVSAVPVLASSPTSDRTSASRPPHEDTGHSYLCSQDMNLPALHDGNDVSHVEVESVASPCCYLGIVSTLDIFNYLAELQSKIKDPGTAVQIFHSSPIHQCLKDHAVCIMSPNSRVLDAMNKMINGMQQVLVPRIIHQQTRHEGGTEASTGYSMVTQTDIAKFILAQSEKCQPMLSAVRQSVESVQVYESKVRGIFGEIPLVDAIRCMHEASLDIVPITEANQTVKTSELIHATGKVIVGVFSACDLKRCPAEALSKWAHEGLLSFLKRVYVMERFKISIKSMEADSIVMHQTETVGSFVRIDCAICTLESSLEDVIRTAVENDVHRVWVVEKECVVLGVITMGDIFKIIRRCVYEEEQAHLR